MSIETLKTHHFVIVLCASLTALIGLAGSGDGQQMAGAKQYTLAVSAGTELELRHAADAGTLATTDGRQLICRHIIDLVIAQVGAECSETRQTAGLNNL